MNWNDLTDEMRAHLEMEVQENIARGMTPEEARYAALRAFGNVTLAQERTRAVWGWLWMETLWQDLRYGWRALRRNPGFTLAAVVSLALGIGANTAIFSALDAVVWRSLPVRDPQRLVIVEEVRGAQRRLLSYPIFRELAARQQELDGVLATGSLSVVRASVEGVGELAAHQLRVRMVSNDYFTVLGLTPILGRAFTPDDDEGVVISHPYWERQFGRDPSVIGRTITLDRTPFSIIGVGPRNYFGEMAGMSADLWTPVAAAERLDRRVLVESHTVSWAQIIGRLKAGVDRRHAESALTALYRQVLADEIASRKGGRIDQPPRIEDCRIELVDGSRGLMGLRRRLAEPLQILMGVVGLVRLIACSTVANLLLARSRARQKEIGIRLAIGAGRGRLVRQLLTESALLGAVGGAAGLILAWLAVDQVVSRAVEVVFTGVDGGIPLQIATEPDWRVRGFTASVSFLAILLFGLAPAWQATSPRVNVSRSPRLSRFLVATQVALSLVLLYSASLIIPSAASGSLSVGAGT